LKLLAKEQIEQAALMLSQAFKDDPINHYAFPNPEERAKKMSYAYQYVLRYNLRYGRVFTTSSQLEGVSVWVHSDNLSSSFWRTLISGAMWSGMRMGFGAGRRMEQLDNYVDEIHRKLVPRKHWYLLILGIDPQHQGKGYASQLLNGMLRDTDEEGVPCYLETDGEQKVSMYQHFGFEVVDEYKVPNTQVHLVAMLREPKKGVNQ
jgi:ribosomal protein S18 acetylase RimI-like enzyme